MYSKVVDNLTLGSAFSVENIPTEAALSLCAEEASLNFMSRFQTDKDRALLDEVKDRLGEAMIENGMEEDGKILIEHSFSEDEYRRLFPDLAEYVNFDPVGDDE